MADASGIGIAPVVGAALASGAAVGIYQVWRRTREPQPFGLNDFLFGLVLGGALAAPLAASHAISAIASDRLFGEEASAAKAATFVVLSMAIYLGAINRADQAVRAAGPQVAARYLSDELALFGVSLALAVALVAA